MTREDWKDLFELVGVVAIVVSLIFLTLEIRTNTATNQIAIYQNYSSNWLLMNGQMAENRELAALVEKAFSVQELDPVEKRQFQGYVNQRITQSRHMLDLYDQGLIPEAEARRAFRAIRIYAQNPAFRQTVEDSIDWPRLRGLIVDEDGLDKWLDAE